MAQPSCPATLHPSRQTISPDPSPSHRPNSNLNSKVIAATACGNQSSQSHLHVHHDPDSLAPNMNAPHNQKQELV